MAEKKLYILKDGELLESKKKTVKTKDKNKEKKFFFGLNLATELGFSIAIPIAGGAVLGAVLDKKFGTAPRITLVFILLGIISSGYYLYGLIKKLS